MKMWRTVNWSRQPETILDGLDHLQKENISGWNIYFTAITAIFTGTSTIIRTIPRTVCL